MKLPLTANNEAIYDADDNCLAHCSFETDALGNAPWLDEIVRRVNLHDELVAALKALVESHGYASYTSDEEKEAEPEVIAARTVLAKVEGR